MTNDGMKKEAQNLLASEFCLLNSNLSFHFVLLWLPKLRDVNEFDAISHDNLGGVGVAIGDADVARCSCRKIKRAQQTPAAAVDLLIHI